jgi:tRNA(fMet)-specific endonuclease VapC
MKWLLDSNACIQYLNGRVPSLKVRVDAVADSDLLICSVVKAELAFGAAGSRDPVGTRAAQRRFLSRFVSLGFDDAAAEVYGKIRHDLTRAGRLIGGNDMLIAAIALANDVTLVTHNTAEFSRVVGLKIEDWELP